VRAGFEEFLREWKKRRKIASEETMAYYRSLFKRYLEDKALSEELVEYVVSHENKWLRNVFRHNIQYLYFMRRIPPETYGWLVEVVPSRSYRLDVRPYPINLLYGITATQEDMEFLTIDESLKAFIKSRNLKSDMFIEPLDL